MLTTIVVWILIGQPSVLFSPTGVPVAAIARFATEADCKALMMKINPESRLHPLNCYEARVVP